jgi:hypothetical protein
MVRKTILIAGFLAVGVIQAWRADAGAATLLWPESGQPVAGREVQLWEDFELEPFPLALPCQAEALSMVVVNGQTIDEVRELQAPAWSECGSVVVRGGWVAIGFDAHRIRAVAAPAIVLREPGGCSYELNEIEGQAGELDIAGAASWTVEGRATLNRGSSSSATWCASALPLTGGVELLGPQSGGEGIMPWGPDVPTCTEKEATEQLGQRMKTATRLSRLGRRFRSDTNLPFRATSPGTLDVTWYADAGDSVHHMLVARAMETFYSRGTKWVRPRLTSRGRLLLRSSRNVTLGMRASFRPHGSASIGVSLASIRP